MNPIPEFPNFRDIELSDKPQIKNFSSKFPPYADFNFSAMWAWSCDSKEKVKISKLYENLVVLFRDYVSGQRFLSFIGKNCIPDTVSTLITYSQKYYNINFLKLIPEEIAMVLPESNFICTADRDSYDYVYYIPDFVNMNNWSKSTIRKSIKKFIKMYPNYVVKQSSLLEINEREYLDMFKKWSEGKNIADHSELNEFKALKRFFQNYDENIKVVSLYVDGVLIGFNIYEIISEDYANSAFSKANLEYDPSIYCVLNWEEAKILNKLKIKYYNWEQDLGILGLRYSKEKYKPKFFLKKFIVSHTQNNVL